MTHPHRSPSEGSSRQVISTPNRPLLRPAADSIAELAAALLLVVALLFGGGSRGVGDLVVHLAALPALAIAVMRWRHTDATRLQRLFVYWLLAAIGLVALQLLPLPAS